MNIAEWNFRHVQQFAQELALSETEGQCTNGALFERATCLANALLEAGGRPGDRVVVALPNSVDLFVVADAVFCAGMVLVLLSDSLEAEISAKVRHCRARFLVQQGKPHESSFERATCVKFLPDEATQTGNTFLLSDKIASRNRLTRPISRKPDDPAQLCYTSGTTEEPKAAIYTHAGLDSFLRNRAAIMKSSRSHRVLLSVPTTAFGARFVAMRVVTNQLYVLLKSFSPDEVMLELERREINSMPLLPTLAEQLIAARLERNYDCSALEVVNISGARVARSIVTKLKQMFAHHRQSPLRDRRGVRIVVHYGMTEAGGGIASSETGGTPGDGNVGRLLDRVEVRILREDGSEKPSSDVGEIAVRTPYAAIGYWNDPVRSATTFAKGFVRTGDLGYVNDRGELFVAGRVSDLINQGGYKILPAEVASLLERIPGVAQCAVIGIDDSLMGEEVVACLVCSSHVELTAKHVLGGLRGFLEPRKWPAQIIFLASLPKTTAGKVDLRHLRAEVLRHRRDGAADGRRAIEAVPTSQRPAFLQREVLSALETSLSAGFEKAAAANSTFGDIGLDSIGAVRLAHQLSERTGVPVGATDVYGHPTLADLCKFLEARLPVKAIKAIGV